jgi:hypothetical protein
MRPKLCRIHDRTGARSESAAGDGVEDFLFRETTGSEFFEGPRDERRPIRIRHQALAGPFLGVEIADRRNEHPAALFERHSDSPARSLGSHVVVELREGGEHAFHQLAGRSVVDRLGDGTQRDPKRLQKRSQGKVVVLLACEPREVVHDD